ncbi:protein-methionine-S-oxide reductase [Trichosporon asahii var. asahii CBS 2479]|uniref:peptide-methionine (S)-S-oxide reductase n=1 Tax=Trichosporon asahii var. asahii (strain ATCC 90039 / CBS 2479 / JCM 2466 / KCTC 7840 / NBRC 103889/ NCYC 2677 / UAMH 7654) TaxID=1186058 RepID=J6ETM2_TRIAS|nr:protein-methionine-S-oxide reductase [Trichosporon asahii var. asahii CBS 2479]EJT46102.1 protein-methionine-S-oxide reductase [Trichosporon asahii var. asahii CBS 2479]
MKHHTPPPPTVPAAIKSADEAKASGLQDGGKPYSEFTESDAHTVEVATFASGCFHLFNKYYGNLPGWKAEVGYTGGDVDDPCEQVCTGRTNHAEGVRLQYQKGAVGYGELVEFFYRTHDPTTLNSQGPDFGSQYRSAIFYDGAEQEKIAKEVTQQVQEK